MRPKWDDGTPAHTKYITHVVNEYDLQKEFPILTLRPVAWKTGLKEMFWIYQDKSNDVSLLEDKYNVNYWREWANEDGNLNKAYGYQAGKKIDFPEGTFDQVDRVLHLLKNDPMNRRIMTNLLPLHEMSEMQLPACCYETLWSVRGNYVDMLLIQRSGDIIPASGSINVTQYALLQTMVAQSVGKKPGKFTHIINNLHIYDRHITIAEELLKRESFNAPILEVNPFVGDFYDFTVEDFRLINYRHGEHVPNIPIAI